MARNIVVFCDGTGNEISTHLSNVLKLYRIATDSATQVRYYDPGVGTISEANPWMRRRSGLRSVFGLATGRGLDQNILEAYQFLIDNYLPGDKIFLFGFSRGAYTVRALAGLVYQIGLLKPSQSNLAHYALTAYRQVPFLKDQNNAWRFSTVAHTIRAPVHFMGLWDSVGSVLVPRRDRVFWFSKQNLPFTDQNPGVKIFRQAAAIDEKRRMFRLQKWKPNQTFRPNPFANNMQAQDAKQVWFAGVHSDVGGGYPESESALAKYPLAWLTDEACEQGLEIDRQMYKRLINGEAREGSKRIYQTPDALGLIHDSMTLRWKPLEYFPKKEKWREWNKCRVILGRYLPRSEPRQIESSAFIHQSAFERREKLTGPDEYKPINWPDSAQQISYIDHSHPQVAENSREIEEEVET